MDLSAGKLQVKGEQEMSALASENNHVEELYHALKGLLGQGHEYTSAVFAREITFSLLRTAPSPLLLQTVIAFPSLCWWQV